MIMIIIMSHSHQNRQTHLFTGRKCNLRVNVVSRMVCGERATGIGEGDEMMGENKYSCYCCCWWRCDDEGYFYCKMWCDGLCRLYFAVFSCLSSSYANSWKSLFQFFPVRPHIYFDLPQVNYNVTACFFLLFSQKTRPDQKMRKTEN